ncbi:MAG: putative ABC transporter ATP-binding protein [Phycisphaerae bacterium]|nr:putative ABC transporter ATP-binding protein [Phycisphaerae bacterium]
MITTVAETKSPIVTCRNLVKTFHQGDEAVEALRHMSFDIKSGELTLLVGPSGCGKTTLLSVIAGILDPTEGEVCVMGQNLHQLTGGQRVVFRGRNIGFVFQHFHLLPALTAEENAALPLLVAGEPLRTAVVKARVLLTQMGLGHRLRAYPATLSGGEQQRVAIARGLVHNPHLLVCDEPTSALDSHTGHIIMELLRQLAVQNDRAVMVVTHDNRIFDLGDRIIFLEDGQITRIEERQR